MVQVFKTCAIRWTGLKHGANLVLDLGDLVELMQRELVKMENIIVTATSGSLSFEASGWILSGGFNDGTIKPFKWPWE